MANYKRTIRVLCTLGPASLNRATVRRLEERGVDLFRINLSHTPLERVAETIELIQSLSHVPICLDTEGAQVRTGPGATTFEIGDSERVRLIRDPNRAGPGSICLTPPSVFDELQPNHLITLDFDGAMLLVTSVDESGAEAVAVNSGKIGANKAAVVVPPPTLPAISEKDRAAVALGLERGVRHFALSFANSGDDVRLLRELAGPNTTIISKIESKRGVLHLDDILAESDEILIDRGDLSREAPLENIPLLQKAIIRKANLAAVPVNVATNLLESMMINRKPTRAELNDIINTLLDGANGLVLAAETAIGKHPIGAVDMVLSMIERFQRSSEGYRIEDLLEGGPTFRSPALRSSAFVTGSHPTRTRAVALAKLPAIEVDLETALDIEQIVHGVYAPVRGFMNRDELESVLNEYRLPTGEVWTMPLLLRGKSQELAAFHPGQTIRLIDSRTGQATALLHAEDKFELDRDSVAERWFGTTDRSHPGVRRFMDAGLTTLGGTLESLGVRNPASSPYELTPAQTRMIFDVKGWSRVIAFHSRNVPHRGHEHIIGRAAERCHADGVLIHPVIGPKKRGDFSADVILDAYEQLIRLAYPNALLAAFATYSRYCGPREAVFTALCRKNFGCTHFVLGRDHTGVGDFYAPQANRELFEQLGDIGITPVYFDAVYFSEDEGATVEADRVDDHLKEISGSRVRQWLANSQTVPEWCMRVELSDWLAAEQSAGRQLFVIEE